MATTRRRALRALSFALLFAGSLAAGVWVAAELGPERLRLEAERALSGVLGETRVGAVSLGWAAGPSITARDIAVYEDGETAMSLERAELRLDLLRLFRGGARFDRLRLDGLDVHIRQLADGSVRPTRLGEWARAAPDEPPSQDRSEDPNPLVASGLRRVEIRDAALRVSRESPDSATATAVFDEATLDLVLGDASRLATRGRLGTARVEVELSGTPDAPRFEARVRGLDLWGQRAWLRQLVPELPALAGVADATVRGSGGGNTLQVDAVSLRVAGGTVDGTPLPALQLRGSGALSPHRLRLAALELVADELVVRGAADLTRPLGATSQVSAVLRAQRLPFESLASYAADFGLDAVATGIGTLGPGSFDAVNLAAESLDLDDLDGWVRAPAEWPEGLRLEADFHSDEVALGDGEPLRALSGRVAIDAAHFAFREVRAQLGDRPLPVMTLDIAEWSRLVGRAGSEALAAVPPVRGRAPLIAWVTQNPPPAPRWNRARLELDWLDHPALLGPLGRVSATLRPLSPGVEVDIHRARWSDVWVSGSGRLSETEGEERIVLEVETHALPPTHIGDPVGSETRGLPARRDGVHWAAGHAIVEVNRVGPYTAREVRAPIRMRGSTLWSDEVSITLAPRGSVRGSVELDLSLPDRVPYRTAFQLGDGDLATLLSDMGLRGPPTEGRVVLGALLEGRLRAGEPMLASMRGPVSAHARDGVVYRRVPWALAIAAVSETFNPFRSRDSLPYQAIDGEFRFEAGRVQAKSFAITGPTVRMVATGGVELAPPYTMEVVAGLFFFRGLDKVLGGVPILSTLLLGSDENLVSAYFSLEGPWNDPDADLIPIKTFLAGPASIVAEGVPNFVFGGLSRLARLFSIKPAKRDEPKAAP